MNFTPIDSLMLAALVGISMAAAVDVSLTGRITWRTPVWAFLFVGGFWVNYNQGGKR